MHGSAILEYLSRCFVESHYFFGWNIKDEGEAESVGFGSTMMPIVADQIDRL